MANAEYFDKYFAEVAQHDATAEALESLQAENARLTSEVARLREDAARYVWCRENGIIAFLRKGAEVDAMVDKEMAKPPVDCPF